MSTSGKIITLTTPDDNICDCYLTGAEDAPLGIVILHEWWGLREHNRTLADRFAAIGYQAIVVDLFDGMTTDDAEEAADLMKHLDQSVADSKLLTALQAIKAPGRKIAVYGCSMGGRQAFQLALLEPEAVACAIIGYSRMETDIEKLLMLGGPVFAIYASQERTWPQKQHDFEAAMSRAGQKYASIVLDAAHGFTNPTSPRYNAEADAAAWKSTIDFLDRTLR
jgi:carboxymethylenebutenolidase